jgi:hypothetical protein
MAKELREVQRKSVQGVESDLRPPEELHSYCSLGLTLASLPEAPLEPETQTTRFAQEDFFFLSPCMSILQTLIKSV